MGMTDGARDHVGRAFAAVSMSFLPACASLAGLTGSDASTERPRDASTDEPSDALAEHDHVTALQPDAKGDHQTCTGSGTGAVATLGCPCSSPGTLACNGNAQKVGLICSSGTWALSQTCPVGQNCNTETGTNQGICATIDPLCADAGPGQTVCSNATSVVTCGRDLVNDSPSKTCDDQVCLGGVCAGACSPGTTECTSATDLATCGTTGQWGAPAPCTGGCVGAIDTPGGACGECTPGTTRCSGSGVETCDSGGHWGGAVACPPTSPICAGGACTSRPAAFYAGAIGSSNTATSAVSSSNTAIGDLLLLCAYIEPANESMSSAAYGTFTPPAGFTLATWEPISSNDQHLTTEDTNRQYVWWGYATTAGAQIYTVSAPSSAFYYADTAVVTVEGYAASGDPFADAPSTATYGDGSNVTAYPSVSVMPAANETGFLWLGTSWHVGYYGYPSGFDSLLDANTLSIAVLVQSAATRETVAPSTAATNLLTAALMTFR